MAIEKIFKGVAKTLSCKAKQNNDAEDPFDFSGATTITACFTQSDGSTLELSQSLGDITVTSATLGKFQVILNASETSVLKEGTQSFFVKSSDGTTETAIPFDNQINVVSTIC